MSQSRSFTAEPWIGDFVCVKIIRLQTTHPSVCHIAQMLQRGDKEAVTSFWTNFSRVDFFPGPHPSPYNPERNFNAAGGSSAAMTLYGAKLGLVSVTTDVSPPLMSKVVFALVFHISFLTFFPVSCDCRPKLKHQPNFSCFFKESRLMDRSGCR